MSEIKNTVTAMLGPTNTGKTHLAVETMLEFQTGIFGFPLRLLAREIYDRCKDIVGINKVALITGEEKIIPSSTKYYICTVESMPVDIPVEFIAVDEIQMCTDQERGHIFTDRLLNLRGSKLTMFLGSQTIKPIISSLVENVNFVTRDRYSKLNYAGYKKISRLDRKTAIIAFSVDEVYAIAELVRRQKGGSAIIMGSLSPKTRNAQVELYQSGDVDFLVATDAIGMGINMNIDNVYFSSLNKFDGKKNRKLILSEISQIAGRAGRYLNDGFFGITNQSDQLSAHDIENLENHNLNFNKYIFWRNSDLDFSNFNTLILSLEQRPNNKLLRRIDDCEDEKVLKFLIKNKTNLKLINEEKFVQTLWECCQIPDFAKKSYGKHIEVVKDVYSFLIQGKKKVLNDYMKKQLNGLDNYQGNIDTLANRISYVRTWSYVSNKKGWVENQDYWIERTINIEDQLSERLHEELTKSFIDKRISILSRSLKQNISLTTDMKNNGELYIDEQYVGKLEGLKFKLDYNSSSLDTDIKSLRKVARQAILPEFTKKINKIIKEDNNGDLKLEKDEKIYYSNHPIASIINGKDYLNPLVQINIDEAVDVEIREKLKFFLEKWLQKYINSELNDLVSLSNVESTNSDTRAICFQLFENNGVLKRNVVDKIITNLSKKERFKLRKMGVKIGRYHIFLPKMLKPNAVLLRTILWKNFYKKSDFDEIPRPGLNFLHSTKIKDARFLLICGFENFNNFFIRIDILEKLFIKILEASKDKKFQFNSDMVNLIGCTKENFLKLLKLLNYQAINEKDFFTYKPGKKTKNTKNIILKNTDNPFKVLSNLNLK